MPCLRQCWRLLLVLLMIAGTSQALGQCGSLANAYGPFDYRKQQEKLVIVETFHFDSGVEGLTRGKSGSLGSDLDYTLRAAPNHPRALMAMFRYGQRMKMSKVPGAHYSVECYMLRAEEFQPDDMMVKVVLVSYLLKSGRRLEAEAKLKEVVISADDYDPNLFYNLGLVQVELGHWDEALISAHRAYGSGFPLPGLKEALKRAGKWRDLPPPPADASPPLAAGSATQ